MCKIASVLKNGFLMAVLFLVVSCSMLNEPVKDFFKEYTETAAIEVERLPESVVVDSRKLNCFSSENDLEITYLLRNPQKYSLDFEYEFNENLTEVPTYDELKFSQSDDKNSVILTISKSYLNRIDKDNIFDKDISGHIKIIESNSGREFKSYQTRLSANTVPPEINDVNVMILKEDDEKQTYVLCFNFPKLTGTVHENDVVEMVITIPEKSDGGFIEREIPVALYDGVISDSDISTSKPAGDLVPSSGGEFVASADSSYIAYYYKTGLELSQDNLIYTLKLKDLYGLSSKSVIGNHSPKLNAPFIIDASGNSVADDASHTFVVDEDTGVASIFIGESGKASYYNTEGSVEKEIDVTGATLNWKVYDSSSGSPVVYSSGKNTGSVELKLPKGKYTIEVSQSKPYYISSETVMTKNDGIVMKVAPNYYVSSSGSDTEGLGSRQKPYATIQNAISEINSNTDIDDDTQAYIRLMSNIQVSDTIEFSDETLPSGRAKNIIMEPYGISNATISLGGLKDRKLLDAKLTAANLTLNNLTLENGSTEDHVANVGMISSSMKLVMNDITIQNSSNSNAALLQFDGDTKMNGCTIRNCYSSSRLLAIGNTFALTDSSITNNKALNILDDAETLTVSNCVITDNTVTGSAASYESAFRVLNLNTLKLAGKLIVKNNKYTDGKPANLLYSSSVSIGIESDLTGSDIHISYAKGVQPSYGNPSIFTSDYSAYNTENPATFFTDDSGYIIGWDANGVEAALHVSADKPNIQIDEDIEITSPTTVVALGTASRSVTFKVLNKSTGEDVTSKADLKLTPKYLNTVLPSDYYSVSGSSVTFEDTIEPGLYTIAVEATVNGAKYSANHNVEVKEDTLMTLSQYAEAPKSGSTVYISSQDDITKLHKILLSNSSTEVNDSLNCIVTNDITLTNFSYIGYGNKNEIFKQYKGTFDGNGHTITVRESPDFKGLFNTVRKDTTIKNLTMAGTVEGNSSKTHMAAFIITLDFAGQTASGITSNIGNVVIENCVNKMNILNKAPGSAANVQNYAAGFVTRSTVKLTIKNCRNEGTIAAESHAAGFINYCATSEIRIINCINTGNISINEGSTSDAGMAAGICNLQDVSKSYIISCINRGKITGIKSGGLVSRINNGATITNSINYGEVNGVGYAGGIAGKSLVSTNLIRNCINISEVHSTQANSSAGRTYYEQGYIIGSADATTSSNIQFNFYINSYDTSIESCGNLFIHGNNLLFNVMFTSDGHTSTTEHMIRKYNYSDFEPDVVEHLNSFITTINNTARPDFSPWTYDSNGLPKLCWEK